MSAGPLTEYAGASGFADTGGDSLTEDLNVYYSVSNNSLHRGSLSRPRANNPDRMATSPGS